MVAAGLAPIVPAPVTSGALKSPWVLQPVFAGFSILSPSWLWIAMPCLFLIVVLLTLGLSGRRLFRVRRVPAWRSATAGVTGSARYTAFGFANPTRPVLALARAARRLQSGRLDAYLAYMLIALIAVLSVVIALS